MSGLESSVAAIRDMHAIRRYAAARGEQEHYLRLVEIVDLKLGAVVTSPRIGSPFGRGSRRKLRLLPTPFLLIYRPRGDEIDVLRIIHGSRDWTRIVR